MSFTLISCATAPTKINKIINPSSHQQQLAQLVKWQIQGRIAIKTPEERFSASMHWQQDGEVYHIRLTNLIGSPLMQLEGDQHYAKLTYNNQTYLDTDPQRLLYRITQWQLPVKNLPSFIKGQVPGPDFSVSLNAQGLPLQIQRASKQKTADNWLVEYASFQDVTGIALPENVTLKHSQNTHPPQNTIKIRIDQWTLN